MARKIAAQDEKIAAQDAELKAQKQQDLTKFVLQAIIIKCLTF